MKKLFKDLWDHEERISRICTIILTLALIIVTISSICATKRIGNIETYLFKEKEKQLIQEKINLAEDLSFEIEFNQYYAKYLIVNLHSLKESENVSSNWFRVTRVKQAKGIPGFVSNDFQMFLETYILYMEGLSTSFEELKLATIYRDNEKKEEHIDRIIHFSKMIGENNQSFSSTDPRYSNSSLSDYLIGELKLYIEDEKKDLSVLETDLRDLTKKIK